MGRTALRSGPAERAFPRHDVYGTVHDGKATIMSLKKMLMRGLAISGYSQILSSVPQPKVIEDAMHFERSK